MKRILIAAATLTLLASPSFAQDNDHRDEHRSDNNGAMMMNNHHDDHRSDNNGMMMNNHHDNNRSDNMMMQGHHDWHKGDRIGRGDWDRGERVADYHQYRLRRPPHGYEWRRVDNNYVLAAVAGGVIASVIAASH